MKHFFHLRYLFWLAVPLLLWWAMRGISLQAVGAVLSRLTLPLILVLIAANGVVLLLFSARWWLISRAQGYPIPYLTLAGYRLAAFGVSYFTPGPQFGGEPLQVYLVERHHNVPRPTAIYAVTLDKTLELLSNFVFLTIGVMAILQWQIFPGFVGQQVIFLTLTLLALPAGFLLAIWTGRRPVSNLWRLGVRFIPRQWVRHSSRLSSIYQVIKNSEDQAACFCRKQPSIILQALFISAVSWVLIIGEYWLTLYVLGVSLTPVQVISMLTAARIAFLLPMPGGLGVLEAGQVLALSAMGLDPAIGIGLSLLIRMRDATLGGLGLWWGGIKIETKPLDKPELAP